MPHVLIAGKIHEAGLTILKNTPGFTWDLVEEVSTASYAPFIAQADALLLRTQPLTAKEIAQGVNLQVVSRHGVGYDAVDVTALNQRGIPLTIVGDVNSLSVAEHTLALLLAVAKQVRVYDAGIRSGNWNCRNSFSAIELSGRTLLVLGFGRIGREVARLAGCFNMHVVAWDPFVAAETFSALNVQRAEELTDGLKMADALTVHLPLSDSKPLLGRTELALLKPNAIVINTARGGIIDERALVEALKNETLAGAGLDVFSQEPPAPDSPLLLGSDRLILSPHSAGLTQEAAMRMSVSAVNNIIHYFNGTLEENLIVNHRKINKADAI
ncbi:MULTISPECIES: hydroxyacid dehydrogenase [Erwinia]|uniref:hydroxyacid dehydrogenase n=1 Tax=Erwinia TaxID=551 RepID=UPI001489C9C8|nr:MULTISPECIES: hydroxyacid dehydrogenase [Erwinia]MCS3606161.1 D-3-phosphoglycerate dehydrogenase [Erwinia rhapontici]NNS05710.1 hydroxyacid dehydrogenase [Erwinia sp. JH02]